MPADGIERVGIEPTLGGLQPPALPLRYRSVSDPNCQRSPLIRAGGVGPPLEPYKDSVLPLNYAPVGNGSEGTRTPGPSRAYLLSKQAPRPAGPLPG